MYVVLRVPGGIALLFLRFELLEWFVVLYARQQQGVVGC